MLTKSSFWVVTFALSSIFVTSAFAAGPCEQIKQACTSAGFVAKEAKVGKGLWKDCVDPMMQGSAAPANAEMPLPTVDPTVVAACKAKHPKFGEGKM